MARLSRFEKGSNPPVTFEFDNNNVWGTGNVRVSFTRFNTQSDIATSICQCNSRRRVARIDDRISWAKGRSDYAVR